MSAWSNIFIKCLRRSKSFNNFGNLISFLKTFNFSGNLELFASVADFDTAIVFSRLILEKRDVFQKCCIFSPGRRNSCDRAKYCPKSRNSVTSRPTGWSGPHTQTASVALPSLSGDHFFDVFRRQSDVRAKITLFRRAGENMATFWKKWSFS